MIVIKNIFLSLCFLFTFHSYAQTIDTVNWRADYKLKWSDFKGKLDSNSTFAAVSSIIMDYDILGTKNNITGVSVKCIFDRKDSQLNYGNINKILSDSNLLAHEQIHFDIAELFARRLRRDFKNIFDKKRILSFEETQKVYNNILNIYDNFNLRYDLETNFSKNRISQKRWTEKITNELKALNKFSI
jgi:hypothetical protein